MREQFEEQGYLGPLPVLSVPECRRFLKAARDEQTHRPPPDWFKGQAASSRAFYEIGMHPAITEVVSALLGEDVILWGATIETRPPGAVHPWHTDIESSGSSGKVVSVWIGLEHTQHDSSILFVPYSHRFGVSVQEVRGRHGIGRDATRDEHVERWARERDSRSHLVNPKMSDGEAIFFDGRLWHGSHNVGQDERRALLLQYAHPDVEIRIPDLRRLDWPFERLDSPRPPCVMVKGNARIGVNRIVPGPIAAAEESMPQLASRVYPVRLPLPPDPGKSWRPYPVFHGSTAGVRSLSCHVSVLHPHQIPHLPHRHAEEEVLLLLAGEVELTLPDAPRGVARLTPGDFVYYPADFAHTLQTTSAEPANYLMFKWRDKSDTAKTTSPIGFGRYRLPDSADTAAADSGFCPRPVFEGPTSFLQKLHCHFSTLTPGAGYDAHIDAHDVGIVVLEGEVETLGQRVGPHSVIFSPAGEPHGMCNPGGVKASYVVFEFHGRPGLAALSEDEDCREFSSGITA